MGDYESFSQQPAFDFSQVSWSDWVLDNQVRLSTTDGIEIL
jgi:hypothetical protein